MSESTGFSILPITITIFYIAMVPTSIVNVRFVIEHGILLRAPSDFLRRHPEYKISERGSN